MSNFKDRAREKFEREKEEQQRKAAEGSVVADPSPLQTPKVQTQGPARMLRENLALSPIRKTSQIDVKMVFVPDNYQRHPAEYDGPEFEDLMESIRKSEGNLDPIDVRFKPDAEGRPRYEAITGTRRLEAVRRLGLKAILANEREIDDAKADLLHDIENAKRAEKRPFSLALQLSNMMRSGRYPTQADLADRLGRNKGVVSTYLSLYDKAPNELWSRVKDPIGLRDADARLLVKAYDKPEFADWVKSLKKADPAPLATILKKAAQVVARPKPLKSDAEKIREVERGDAYHLVLPKSLPQEVRAKVLAFARELASKL